MLLYAVSCHVTLLNMETLKGGSALSRCEIAIHQSAFIFSVSIRFISSVTFQKAPKSFIFGKTYPDGPFQIPVTPVSNINCIFFASAGKKKQDKL